LLTSCCDTAGVAHDKSTCPGFEFSNKFVIFSNSDSLGMYQLLLDESHVSETKSFD